MSEKWISVIQTGVLVVGGLACFAFGQAQIGTAMLGAAMGGMVPQAMFKRNGSQPTNNGQNP